MPIRWSVLQVCQKLDQMEGLLPDIEPILGELVASVGFALEVPNLPDYVKQPLWGIEGEATNMMRRMHDRINRLRDLLPKEKLAKEQGTLARWLDFYGDEQRAKLAASIFGEK